MSDLLVTDTKIKALRRRLWLSLGCFAVLALAYVLFVELVMTPGYPAGTVAVAKSPAAHAAGVNAHPLEPGESLAFDYGSKTEPVWNMAGVDYPLVLTALDRRGKVLDVLVMKPCKDEDPVFCPQYVSDVSARFWVETRPSGSKVREKN